MTKKMTNLILIILTLLIAITPLIFLKSKPFSGTDSQAKEMITLSNPNYQPWFQSVFEPASSEVESFFFALQAAIGAGVLGYLIGYMRGKKKAKGL